METKRKNVSYVPVAESISYLKKVDPRLSKVIDTIGTIGFDTVSDRTPFEFLTHEIVGQMISAKVKATIYSRFINLCGGIVTPDSVLRLTVSDLRSIGLSTSKSTYLLNLAEIVSSGEFNFDKLVDDSNDVVINKLTSIRGIGKWTANMYLLFYLRREDVLPVEDVAFLQTYKWLYETNDIKPKSIKEKCKYWSPYSSIASRYMYRALDTGLTKIDIKAFLA